MQNHADIYLRTKQPFVLGIQVCYNERPRQHPQVVLISVSGHTSSSYHTWTLNWMTYYKKVLRFLNHSLTKGRATLASLAPM